jgi:hypothetical protein
MSGTRRLAVSEGVASKALDGRGLESSGLSALSMPLESK